MICSACGTTNPAQARFCLHCGQPVVAGYVCSDCHTLLPPHARFCFHCGAMVIGPEGGMDTVQHAVIPQNVRQAATLPPITNVAAPLPPQSDVTAVPAPRTAAAISSAAPFGSQPSLATEARPMADLLPSLKLYLSESLYEPLERRSTKAQLELVRDHLIALLRTTKTYLPRSVVTNPQLGGVPTGGVIQGTFMFVDVTGFTALSERLSRHGRAGAEHVTELMNDLFFDLVSILFDHGGSLLKFGGDALLGVFDADSDEMLSGGALQAVRASFAMQAIMGKFSQVEAAGKTSALHIKCGVSTGRYFAAHVGTPDNMAYVTTGHTVNRAEQCEDHAEPGEIIISQSTYDLIKDSVQAEERAEGFYHLLAFNSDIDTIVDTGFVIPQDEDPTGDLHTQIAYLVDRMDRLAPYLAADLLPRIVGNPDVVAIEPEHRPVTVMFANYAGISELIEDLGDKHPDLITQQLNSYFVHMAGVVEKYEGTLARMDQYAVGDRLIIFFGAPRAHEDDPVRAVYTALDMQAETRKHFAALQTPEGVYRFRQRIGINTGHLFAGNVGAANLRQEYTLMGDDINMAARLMSKAGWDEVFVSGNTRERVSAYIELEDQGEIKVKGKEIPVRTYKVKGRRQEVGHTRGLESGDSPLTGRDQQLETSLRTIDAVINGRGQIVTIIGDSGRGKSRLVREMKKTLAEREDTQKLLWLEGQALSFSEQVSYWLVAQILYDALGLPADTSPDDTLFTLWEKGEELLGHETACEAVPFLAHLLNLPLQGEWATWITDLDPKARQKQMFWAMREFFTALAEKRPTVIWLDDVHWADEASLALIEDLLSVSDHAPLMFCLVFREWRDKGAWRLRDKANSTYAYRTTQIDVPPLTQAETSELLQNLLPGVELTSAARSEILEKAAGNPFYLEEVVRTLIESGAVVRDPDNPVCWRATEAIDDIAVPDSLQGAIVSRLDRLAEEARQALQMASVIGRRFEVEVLRGLAGVDEELEGWLAQLERSGMIRPAEQTTRPIYNFPDALVQEVAYEGLLVQRRKEFHRLAGETLEAMHGGQIEQHCEMLAYHFSRSDDKAKAIKYLDMAGDIARKAYANETALFYYNTLLDLLGDSEETWQWRFDTLNDRQRVFGLLGRQGERETDLKAMLLIADNHADQKRRGDTLNSLADLYQWTGRYDESTQAAGEALTLKEAEGDAVGQAEALHQIGVVRYYRGAYSEAQPALERAAALRHTAGDPAGESWSHLYVTMIHLVSGNYGEALISNERALQAAESRQDWLQMGIHLNNGARIAHRLGEYELALQQFEKSMEMRSRVGDRTGLGFTLFGIGLVHTYMSRYDEAAEAFQKSTVIRTQINDERGISYCLYGMGLVSLGRGQLEQAEGYLEQAKALHEKLNLNGELIADLSYLGLVYLQMGEKDKALAASQDAITRLADTPNVEEVQQIYLNHYRVLKALNELSAADVLRQADKAVLEQASAIADPDKREVFLTKVRVNREIRAEMETLSS